MCEERKPSLDEQIAIAKLKVKPPKNSSDSSDDEIFIDKEHNNNPIPQEPEIG